MSPILAKVKNRIFNRLLEGSVSCQAVKVDEHSQCRTRGEGWLVTRRAVGVWVLVSGNFGKTFLNRR